MNHHHFKPVLFGVLFGAVLSGCTAMTSMSMTTHGGNADEFALETKQLTATGYGTAEKSDKYSLSQIKLMAMRSSKLDAYRSLSEQVYGVRLSGVTTVENMIITHDSYKSYVDAYLRGAKVLRTVAINHDKYAGDDTFETVVAIELTPRFYECMNGSPALVKQCMQIPVPPKEQPELVTPFSSAAPTVQVASAMVLTPTNCNSSDCYGYPLTSGFNRPLPIAE
ncbi:MAG: LPP20 family lipoprotein [Methylococcales bacterium]